MRERIARRLRRLRAEALEWSGRLSRAASRLDGSRAAVLTYHRILPAPAARARAVEPGMVVTPQTFARQLDWLASELRILPLGEIVERLRAARPLPLRAVAITFDDGWRDNHDYAFPALDRRGLPATVFLVTARVGTSGAFWPDEVCRRLGRCDPRTRRGVARQLGLRPGAEPVQAVLARLKSLPETQCAEALDLIRALAPLSDAPERELLDEAEIARMAAAGIDFEAHGATHRILTAIADREVRHELEQSRAWLRARGLGRRGLFAYPSGAWSDRVRAQVAVCGFTAALTADRGLIDPASDLLRLPRLSIHEDVSGTRAELLRRILARA